MNKLKNLDTKKKIILITSIITLIILGIVSATVAYFAWVGEESSISVTVIGGEGKCSVKEDNEMFLEPTETRDGGRIIKFTAEQMLAEEAYIYWNMIINEINGLNHETFKYEMINTTTGVSYGSGTFADIGNGSISSLITFSNDTEILPINTTYEFTLYLWIDGTIGNNPYTMAGQDIDFDMNCTITEELASPSSSNTLIDFIKNKYTSGNPTLITHSKSDGTSDTYYYSYQDETETWGLMNDGLKLKPSVSSTGATIITDATALTSGKEGNIRYFGPSDKVNNYIYFNCSDYSSQSSDTCELWRIIGIVDGKIKIIRDSMLRDMTGSIAYLSWDQDKNQDSSLTTRSNNWETSSLQLFLNGLYYNRGTTTTHDYFSGGTSNEITITTLNLETIGITEATRNNNLISKSTWYLGGYNEANRGLIYPNEIYNYERTNEEGTTIYSGNPFTIDTNIGLMYPSDYGYGTDLTKCSDMLTSYSSSTNSYACRANNWLMKGRYQWLITPDVDRSTTAWTVDVSGGADPAHGVTAAGYVSVFPTLYLEPKLGIDSQGNGSSTNPYRISV